MEEAYISPIPLMRPYQLEIGLAVVNSIFGRKGLTICVEIARQGGKNELSAQLEALMLTVLMNEPMNIIKCSPTFQPQAVLSMDRLKDRLNAAGMEPFWRPERGYIMRMRYARAIFLSADLSANVVGHTAHIMMEVDEAQDVNKDKYSKEFRPMGSTTNVTTILYGTTWDETTLLEETKQTCLELEKRDGQKRVFRYDWQEVVKHNPEYLSFVEAEKDRLGENHPMFLTQYRLLPVPGGGGFFNHQQKAQLQGRHLRCHGPVAGTVYIAGIDLAGEAEEAEGERLKAVNPRQDSTVVTIAEITFPSRKTVPYQPDIRIVEHYRWTGERHTSLYRQLVDILGNVWNCRRIIVDATGAGQPVSSFLVQALGSRVVPFTFSSHSKTELGFGLLSAVNSGRLKMYKGDGSDEFREFWFQIENARSIYRPNQTMNFFVDPTRGHDDFLMSLALVVEAAGQYEPKTAKGHS